MLFIATKIFKRIFKYLELRHRFNIEDPIDLFCLHFVFIPRINAALDIFAQEWNNHPLRTVRNNTPQQLFYGGMIQNGIRGVNYEIDMDDIDGYGVDWDGPVAEAEEEEQEGYDIHAHQVVVIPPRCPLTNEEYLNLQTTVIPLYEDNKHGVDVFRMTREVVHDIINRRGP